MPLLTLSPDPQPTDQDLEFYLVKHRHFTGDFRRWLAELEWTKDRLRVDDSAFHVPFASGVEGYKAYQDTAEWKAIRKRVLKAAGHECAGCGGKATQVHHRDYRPSVLRGENDLPLVASVGWRSTPRRAGLYDVNMPIASAIGAAFISTLKYHSKQPDRVLPNAWRIVLTFSSRCRRQTMTPIRAADRHLPIRLPPATRSARPPRTPRTPPRAGPCCARQARSCGPLPARAARGT